MTGVVVGRRVRGQGVARGAARPARQPTVKRRCCVCRSAGGRVWCRLVCLCGRAAQRLAVVLRRMAGKGRARFCGRTHSLQRSLCDCFGCTSRSSSAADGGGAKCDATRGAASKRAAAARRADARIISAAAQQADACMRLPLAVICLFCLGVLRRAYILLPRVGEPLLSRHCVYAQL